MDFKPGIYHDVPMSEYRDIKAFSNSGIKDLTVSPLTYSIKGPYNPDRPEEDEDTPAKIEGKAWHVRILEGRDVFDAAYATNLDRADYPYALDRGDDLRDCCKKLGVSDKGTIREMSERIRAADPEQQLWHFIKTEHDAANEGKIGLSAKVMQQIEIGAGAIEANPDLMPFLRGGKSEVTLLWIDDTFGIPMKARLDWLTDLAVIDIKTFVNMMDMPVEKAVGRAMANLNYGVQAVTYLRALKALGLPANRFIFAFLEKGIVPNIILREFKQHSTISAGENVYWTKAVMAYDQGLYEFHQNYERFGERLWLAPVELKDFEDTDFPGWYVS